MSTETRVVNKRGWPSTLDTVYIGRGSKWGNPASHIGSRHSVVAMKSRAEALEHYREHLRQHPELVKAAREELQGKFLACYCAPLPCHGDILARVADGGEI